MSRLTKGTRIRDSQSIGGELTGNATHLSRPPSRLAPVGGRRDDRVMRDLDDLIADIDQLEAEADADLRPLPGESDAEFRARMLREFDELNALEEDGGGDPDPIGWDAWRWTPPAEPVTCDVPRPAYLIEEWEISTVLPKGGPLTTWIGGRRLGTLNAAA
ncbi:hypothetical protein MOKP118_42940 [Mycobacterium avium subsp. hominissuis]